MSIVSSKLKELRALREKELKKRKNFFPALAVTLLLWGLLTFIVLLVDPVTSGAMELFMLTFFLANLFTFSLIFGKARRGLLVALGITLFAFLRYLGIGNLLNLVLIIGILTSFEVYLTRKS